MFMHYPQALTVRQDLPREEQTVPSGAWISFLKREKSSVGHSPRSRTHMCRIPCPKASNQIKLNNTGLGARVWNCAVDNMVSPAGPKREAMFRAGQQLGCAAP